MEREREKYEYVHPMVREDDGRRRVESRNYTDDEVHLALAATVACFGSPGKASKLLAQEGVDIPEATISYWKRVNHADLYEQIRIERGPELEARFTRRMRDIIGRASEVEMALIEKEEERIEAGKEENPAQAASYISKVKAMNADKLRIYTDRPDRITETRNIDEIARALRARGVQIGDIEGEAEELPEAAADG